MGTSADLFGSSVKLSSLQNDPPEVANEQKLLAAVVSKVGPFADSTKLIYHIRISAGKVHWAVNSYLRSILTAPSPPREDFDSERKQPWVESSANSASSTAAADENSTLWGSALRTAATGCKLDSIKPQQQVRIQQQKQQETSQTDQSQETAASAAHAGVAHSSSCVPTQAAVCIEVLLSSLPSNALELILSYLDLWSLLAAASSCKAVYKAAQSDRLWQQLFNDRWGPVIFPTNKHLSTSGRSSRGQQTQPPHGTSTSRTVAPHTSPPNSRSATGAAASSADFALPRTPASNSVASQKHPSQVTTAGAAVSRHMCSNSSRLISCWTGSSLPGPTIPMGQTCPATTPGQAIAPSAQDTNNTEASDHSRSTTCDRDVHTAACRCSSCAVVRLQPPAGSWRLQYKQQFSYQAVRRCPKCGEATVLPVVYGFPSGPLLAGMHSKRLLLGGDHLIESCHVWACSGCRSCYRYYPYGDVQLWWQDDEAQQRLDQARAAASRGNRRAAAGLEGAGGGALHDDAGGDDAVYDERQGDIAGLPRYTYEL